MNLHEKVLYWLYRSDGGRTYGSLCDLVFDCPDNSGWQRRLYMNEIRRCVAYLIAKGWAHRYGIEDGVWWIETTEAGWAEAHRRWMHTWQKVEPLAGVTAKGTMEERQ